MKQLGMLLLGLLLGVTSYAATDTPDTLVVARDGSGKFRNLWEAIEDCRAFMDYHKVIYVKKGVYKEKVIIPSWLTNIEILGEDRDETIITYDDHANIRLAGHDTNMGTFRTYTVKVEGSDITFRNITIENNAAQKGQAVALHTEGDRLKFVNCRILGNHYVTAASTPKEIRYGYVFNHCKLTAEPEVKRVFLGRPWRPYAYTLFMNCELGGHIVAKGWHNWGKASNEQTARYAEYHNTGAGAATGERAPWSRQLTDKEAAGITLERVFSIQDTWNPLD